MISGGRILKDGNYASARSPHALNDVSIQADIHVAEPTTYESEDETMGRRKQSGRLKRGTPLYSKQDIREQYCINDRQLLGLEDTSSGLFGCLSSYQDSSCSSRSPSLLTVCVRRRVPSDENLAELVRRPVTEYAPFPRWIPPYPVHAYPPPRPKSYYYDPYAWLPEDDEPCRIERPRSVRDFDGYPRRYLSYSTEYLLGRHEPCPAHPHILPPPPPPPLMAPIVHRPKHVSFARSHTMQSFDDTVSFGSGSCITSCSQERLIDGKKSSEMPKVIVLEKAKRAPMKTQATQTEVCLGRKPLPPNYLSLSPRTVQRVRMVSQGAQTNGEKGPTRQLMKSYSEVGKFATSPPNIPPLEIHEPIQRTQSDEPRSPYLPTSPKEIFINFEPLEKRGKKRLAKTLSDGEILEGKGLKEEMMEPCTQSDGELASTKSTQEEPEEKRTITQIDVQTPRKLITADSQEEEFHENLIYQNIFRKRSDSGDSAEGPEQKTVIVPTTPSPFASCDSLNTKDHSDSIWNESQMTVLHADSDNNGAGTGMSCSDLSTSLAPSAAISAMTPSARRKHLLMVQHQQRSSIDTDALDNEEVEIQEQEMPAKSRVVPCTEKPIPVVAVTVPTQEKTPEPTTLKVVQQQKDRKERPLSPSQRLKRKSTGTRTPDSEQHHSSSATLSKAFGRSDSGKTNTDMSEASTTDDYATATENNSDASSRPHLAEKETFQPGQGTGSFESGSSVYSLTRADATEEQQVPCSPPTTEAETKESSTEQQEDKGGDGDGDTSSAESSSCGSYSVEGSSDKLGHSDKSHCSSTGGYDSPFEDQKQRKWTHEDKSRVKKGFKLELSANIEQPEGTTPTVKSPWQKKTMPPVEEKEKTPVKTPSQPSKRTPTQGSRETTPSIRSPGVHETYKKEELTARLTLDDNKVKISNGIGAHSSDESSDECTCGKKKRTREIQRRKIPVAKSPTTLPRERRRSVSGEDLGKRRCSIVTKSPSPVRNVDDSLHMARLSPHSALSPGGSPSRQHIKGGITSPDSTRLKALSAESLRSVSPGSDSVFYSEPSSNTVTDLKSQPVCQHCGQQYESPQGTLEKPEADIVQPPAGFEDSPRTPHRVRHYKKADKRYRSEERRNRIHAEAARAKSEERAREDRKEKIRPLTRSTDASMEKLHIQSSFDDDDDWSGVVLDAYNFGTWVYIGGPEELQVWQRPDSRDEENEDIQKSRKDSIESTHSEEEFRRKYQAITHRMVHRKSSLEMYKRLASKCFEVDKRVLVKRGTGEFGFRIHGSKPVVVSCIEAGTPAESSGLEVGDIIINVNNINVLDATHSEVVKLAHAGADILELEVARTYDKVSRTSLPSPIIAGCLYRLSQSMKVKGNWVWRYFVLKQDQCLYHYKSESGGQPLGAIHVSDYTVVQSDSDKPHSFRLSKKGVSSLHLAAASQGEADQWMTALKEACQPKVNKPNILWKLLYNDSLQVPSWMSETCLNAPPTKIHRPDCAGTLSTLVHHRGKTWRRRFCILKDASMYFYSDINAEIALGMVCLHGYRVQSSTSASRKFAFELYPPDQSLMHFYFYTDTELDKKRWLAALEYSIDRWIKVG
ncbi:uncharacterized protein LOC106669477 isoform X2 [Cimex lectularius]|uniref:Uncharacterized protein n=1 Tax=Cimex lectularius TaxID=79782 RepID=A0A8I6SSG4_CIMLE|nr:uncharacterized protein LOC106669477 isoform X2 [Cimex lectularius]